MCRVLQGRQKSENPLCSNIYAHFSVCLKGTLFMTRLTRKKRISTALITENPVSSPMVPPIRLNWASNLSFLSLKIWRKKWFFPLMLENHMPGHKMLCQSISGQVARTTLASLRLKKNIGDKLLCNGLTKAHQMGWRIEKYILHKTPLVSTICLHQLLQLLWYFVQIFKARVLSGDANISVHADTRSPAVETFVELLVNAVSSWRAAHLPFLNKCWKIY